MNTALAEIGAVPARLLTHLCVPSVARASTKSEGAQAGQRGGLATASRETGKLGPLLGSGQEGFTERRRWGRGVGAGQAGKGLRAECVKPGPKRLCA